MELAFIVFRVQPWQHVIYITRLQLNAKYVPAWHTFKNETLGKARISYIVLSIELGDRFSS